MHLTLDIGLQISTPGSGALLPTVTGVSPTSGSTAGGTPVTLTGTNFTGATAVKFGTTAATSVVVVSSTSITCVSPAVAASTVDVTVTTPGGTSATGSADHFTYSAPSSLLSNLLAYYAFETLTTDSSGNGNTLTNVGGITQGTGLIGDGATGATSTSTYLSGPGFNMGGSTDWTVVFWCKFTNFTHNNVPLELYYTGGGNHAVFFTSGSNTLNCYGPPSALSGTVSTTGWNFVVLQYKYSNNTWYMSINNGTATSASGAYPSSQTSVLQMLSDSFGYVSDYMLGTVDEVGIWQSSSGGGGFLTSTQLTNLYNSGSGVTYPFTGVP